MGLQQTKAHEVKEEVAVLVEPDTKPFFYPCNRVLFPRRLDVVVSHVGRVANTHVVATSTMSKHTPVDQPAIIRRGSRFGPLLVNLNPDVTLEVPTLGQPAVAGPQVEHRT